MKASSVQVGMVGLSPEQLVAHFPFHVAVDESMQVIQYGRSLAQLIPEIRIGIPIAGLLRLRRPCGGWVAEALSKDTELLHIAEHEPTKLVLRGQMVCVAGEIKQFIFLASPWVDGPEALDRLGLTLGDFALHDVSLDLIQVVQSMRIANDDLRRLASILKGHRSELQRVNAELSARNEQLELTSRDLVDAQQIADLGNWRYDSATDHLETSSGFVSIFGGAGDHIPSTFASWLEFVHPADRLRVEQMIRDADGNAFDIDFRIIRSDGRRRYVHLRCRVGLGVAPSVIKAGTLQDVTVRKRTERMLRVQRRQIRKLALVASKTDNGVVITDVMGRIEWANRAFRRQSGFAQRQLRGRKPGDLLQVPETSQDTIKYMRAKLAAHESFNVELLNAAADGRRYWVAIDVQPIRGPDGVATHFISVQRDITAMRIQQADLERLHAERELILELSSDGFLAFDENGAQVYSNSAAAYFMGLQPEALSLMDEFAVDARLASLSGEGGVFVPARVLADGATDILNLIDARMTLRRAVRNIAGDNGVARGRVVYLTDITREKELDRMRTEFLATAAHELRTPMSSIHGFSELLMTRELDAPTRREVVEIIHHQSNFVVRMVNDLLDLERLSSGAAFGELRMQAVGVVPLVRRVIDGLLIENDPRRVQFQSNGIEEPLVLADPDKLAQALINLLANAYRYSRTKGGAIELVLSRRQRKSRVEIGIAVRDHGIGMTVAQIQKVFERFYRADPSSAVSGTGLGMTLVKEIIERMDGIIEIDSAPDLGATVTLWLPEVLDR